IAYDSHPDGVILVTDAMSAMGLVPGNYQLGNMNVTKDEDRVYIEGTDTLAGSVITLDACIRNFIQFTNCSLIEALEAVTLHPAVLLGIEKTKGVIKPGADADLVLLSDDLFVKRVFVAGEEVDLESIDVQVTEKFQ
ncbi:putative N-acetylglucosamine-6-phosphate deacetylase, partial [Modicella reniformis]